MSYKIFYINSDWHANAWEVYSAALSKWIFLIENQENCARNLIIWAWSLVNATFLVESKQACDHLVDALIKTIKYLNGPHDGCIGPQISSLILSKKDGDSKTIFFFFEKDGLVISLLLE